MPAESHASEASVSALYSTLQDLGCEVTNIRLRIEQDIFSLQDQNSALQLSVDQLQHTLSENGLTVASTRLQVRSTKSKQCKSVCQIE